MGSQIQEEKRQNFLEQKRKQKSCKFAFTLLVIKILGGGK